MRDLRAQLKALGDVLGVRVSLGPDGTILVDVYKNEEKTVWTCYIIHPNGEVEKTHFSVKEVHHDRL
jgi:hypothetical protein